MAYAPMFEMWRRMEDETPFDHVLDLGHGEDYPVADLTWFLGVRLPMTSHEKDGTASPEENARLNLVENRVRDIVKQRDGRYVGRRTGGGNRDLVFYLPGRPRGLEDRIRNTVGTEILFVSRPDPRWEGYESMMPDAREWRQIEDRRALQDLLNADIEPDTPHRLVHTVETSLPKGAEALLKLYAKLELIDCETAGKRPSIRVSGVQISTLSLDAIHRVSWILESRAPKARGAYLGWDYGGPAEDELFPTEHYDETTEDEV